MQSRKDIQLLFGFAKIIAGKALALVRPTPRLAEDHQVLESYKVSGRIRCRARGSAFEREQASTGRDPWKMEP